MTTKEQIEFSEFLEIEKKLDIRIGQIAEAERVPKSDKLLKLTVIFGSKDSDIKTVVTNIGSTFEPDELLGSNVPFIVNLKPTKMMGIVSEAMIIIGSNVKNDGMELEDYSIGTKII
jgi:methionyl-tRNA synthetase